MVQQGDTTYNVTLFCTGMAGFILLMGYIVFTNLVTRKGDFYHNRRWKASVWVANIFGIILGLPLWLFIGKAGADSSGENVFEAISATIGGLFSILAFILPFVFMVCIGIHHQLKWWLNSDDYLDKIWKDPNKGQKTPIQDV